MPVYRTGCCDDVTEGQTDSCVSPRPALAAGGCQHLTQFFCVTPTNTHPPIYSIPILLDAVLQLHFHYPPTPSPESSSRTGPVDKPGSLIIHFPIINHHCFNTMSPKKSQRQQRKHLPLSRQGTNSRIRESASLHTQDWKKHKHMHIGHAFIPSDVVFFLCYKTRNSSCFRT